MAKKVYEVKFQKKKQAETLADYVPGHNYLGKEKKSVIVKAKNKDKVRDMIDRAADECLYFEDDRYIGEEGEEFTIKKIADSVEEYEEEEEER